MELMWGLKNCFEYLVPSEKLELSKDDHLRMSKGMEAVLGRYNLKVEPEMVNEQIIETTAVVYNYDHFVNKHAESLRPAGELLKKISNIDPQNWGLVKVAIALKIPCYPEEELPGNPLEVFSAEEYSKLVNDRPRYEGKFFKVSCKIIFQEMISVRRHRNRMLGLLAYHVVEARKGYDAGEASKNIPSKKRKIFHEAATEPRKKLRWPRKWPQPCQHCRQRTMAPAPSQARECSCLDEPSRDSCALLSKIQALRCFKMATNLWSRVKTLGSL